MVHTVLWDEVRIGEACESLHCLSYIYLHDFWLISFFCHGELATEVLVTPMQRTILDP